MDECDLSERIDNNWPALLLVPAKQVMSPFSGKILWKLIPAMKESDVYPTCEIAGVCNTLWCAPVLSRYLNQNCGVVSSFCSGYSLAPN